MGTNRSATQLVRIHTSHIHSPTTRVMTAAAAPTREVAC